MTPFPSVSFCQISLPIIRVPFYVKYYILFCAFCQVNI